VYGIQGVQKSILFWSDKRVLIQINSLNSCVKLAIIDKAVKIWRFSAHSISTYDLVVLKSGFIVTYETDIFLDTLYD